VGTSALAENILVRAHHVAASNGAGSPLTARAPPAILLGPRGRSSSARPTRIGPAPQGEGARQDPCRAHLLETRSASTGMSTATCRACGRAGALKVQGRIILVAVSWLQLDKLHFNLALRSRNSLRSIGQLKITVQTKLSNLQPDCK